MRDKNVPSVQAENFFRLPFKPGTRILTLDILNDHSDFRRPKKPYLLIETRKLSFVNEVLTLGIVLDDEEEEFVYIRVTASELLVSCSVDTEKDYLSRSAYFALYYLMLFHRQFDFEDFYWPGFFDPETGDCKYLMISKSKGSLAVAPKIRYKGLYKPGQPLPVILKDISTAEEAIPKIQEPIPKERDVVIGFCLADTHPERWHSNHYPFLIPYIGVLDKKRTFVKGFKSYVLDEQFLSETDLSDEQQRLVEICFAMKKIALIQQPEYKENVDLLAEKQEKNKYNFNRLFELWQEAIPILAGRLYTHYHFTFGMRNVKGKPSKLSMKPCRFNNEVPKICFLWKEIGDYYKIELRLMVGKEIHEVTYFYNTTFFVRTSGDQRNYFLLDSLMDNELISFFQKYHFQLLILKVHYEGYCEDFINQLKTNYQFLRR